MFINTKCECGHQNHTGTVLCESCGKPLMEDDSTAPLEMRYDGVARRSQRDNPSWIDRVWRFFSSVKVAVYLIFITLCLSMIGTIYPQENTFVNMDAAAFYSDRYGTLGEFYYFLGFSHTYESWWFRGLLVMIGASLVICSIDRVLPLYRALSKQQIRKHKSFIGRQKIVYSGNLMNQPHHEKDAVKWVAHIAEFLRKKKRYRVHQEGTALLAEKNRFSRWGPYINHIGLIIFLLAVLMRSIPGWHMDEYMSIMEGETKKVAGTNYYLKNEQFTVEYYQKEDLTTQFREEGRVIVKKYETKAVLYECIDRCDIPGMKPVLEEVKQHDIIVNHPLEYKGLLAYQVDFDLTPQILSVQVTLKNNDTGQALGKFLLDMNDPEASYQVGSYDLQIKNYYPDFEFKDGKMGTKSSEPNAPAFVFNVTGPGMEPELLIYFPKPQDKVLYGQDRINQALGSSFSMVAESMEDVEVAIYTTFLNIRVDRAMPYIWVGAAISMIGLVMGFYWHHRRIWLRVDEHSILLGAHTNKNWYGIRNEVASALQNSGIEVDPKTLEKEVNSS